MIIQSFGSSKRLALSLVLVIAAITVIDTTIVGFIAFSNSELSTVNYIILFVTMSVLFVIFGLVLLRVTNTSTIKQPKTKVRWLSIVMYIVFSIIVGVVFSIIIQIVLLNNYQINFLKIADYVAHISTLLFLGYLVLKLVKWIKSNRNVMLIAYAVSFSLLCIYLSISCVYLAVQINSLEEERGEIRMPISIHFSLTSPPAAALQTQFGPILDVLSLCSFLSAWVATIVLLRQYRQRIGNLRYWSLVIAPLVYFLFPFGTYFIDISNELMANSPVLFSVIYVTVFGATKQVGGILFSMVFLTAAFLVNRTELRKFLITTAIGISVLFGCIGTNSLLYAIYPPFGLITISFMPVGAYLLFDGMYGSAKLVSEDAELRKKLHKSVENQISLLKTIGVSQMEAELLRKMKPVAGKVQKLQEDNETQLEQEDVRLLIRDVLKEIDSRRQQN
jgi:hypothetical protein